MVRSIKYVIRCQHEELRDRVKIQRTERRSYPEKDEAECKSLKKSVYLKSSTSF